MTVEPARTARLTTFRAVELIASVLAPAAGAIFTSIDHDAKPFRLNQNNATSFVLVLSCRIIEASCSNVSLTLSDLSGPCFE
jgi:hypothetical protein